jgi:predicted transcriptional regulator
MEQQLIIRVDTELKARLARLAQTEGKNSSQVIRELMTAYVTDRDIAGHIDAVWTRTGAALCFRGRTAADVPAAIRAVRKTTRR